MIILALGLPLISTHADLADKPLPSWSVGNEKGWFWGEREKWEAEQKKLKEAKEKAKQAEAEKPKEKNCKDPKQWDVTCGFVLPERDFDFSQLQYAELTKQLAMYPDDAEKVKQYQKFVSWAVGQAVLAAKTAEWNIQQNQDMNPFINNPVSMFGMRAAGAAAAKRDNSIVSDIRDQGGVLVFFSRSDCDYCHEELPILNILSKDTGLPLYNASLDENCLEGFTSDFCYTGLAVQDSARNLGVAIVPDVWLFLPEDKGWIRVSSGVETLDVIKSRIITFFTAAKRAAEKGMARAANSPQPAVDFSSPDIYERAKQAVGIATGAFAGDKK